MAMAPKPKKRLKLPTGELPKRLSKAAASANLRSGFEGARAQQTPSASAAAVGRERDKAKKMVQKSSAVKKTSSPVKITGSATGTKSLTAAQVAKMNKMTSKYKMGNR